MQKSPDHIQAYSRASCYSMSGVVFQGDQVVTASSASKSIRVWDGTQKEKVTEYTCPGSTLALAQGSEGEYFSGEADGTLRRWRFSLETVGQEVGKQEGAVTAIQTCGKAILTGSQGGPLFIWDETGAKRKLVGHARSVHALLFGDPETAMSGSEDATLKIWDLTQDRCVGTIRAHDKRISALALHPNGIQCFSGSEEGSVRLWDQRRAERCLATFWPNLGEIRALGVSETGSHLVLGGERVQLLDLRSFEFSKPYDSSPASCLAIQRNRLAFGTTNGALNLYELPGGLTPLEEVLRGPGAFCPLYTDQGREPGRLFVFQAQQNPVCHLAFQFPQILTADSEGNVALHMLSLEREAVEERYFIPRQGPLVSLGFLPDSKKVFSATSEKLSLWEGQKREDYSVASGDKIRVTRSQGGYILLGTEQGVLHVYHKEGRCFNLGSSIVGLDLHEGQVLALDVNGSLHLTSLHTQKTSSYPLLKGPLSEVLLFAYLPQKEMLVVGFKGTLHRFRREGEAWMALKEFSFLRGARYALTADGLLLEGEARCLSMWNLDTGSPVEDDREISQPVGSLTSQGELSLLACSETRHLFAYSSGGKEVTISSIELPPVNLEIDPTIPLILYHEMANLTKIEGASGNFGQIYRGGWNRMPIAFKQVGIPREGKQKQRQDFAHEVRMMWELRGHPNFSTLYGYCLEPLGLVMLFEEGGTLKKQIESTPPLSMSQKYLFALDVASGLAELHRRGAIHADLKSENVLVGKDKRGKLADFGLAHVSSYKTGHAVAPGDVFWQAPEVLSQLGPKDTVTYTKAADIYSLGLVLYHLFTGRIPFDNHAWTLRDFILQLTSGLRPPLTDLPVQGLIQACWQADAHKRPAIEEVKRQLEALMGPTVSSTQATAKIKESFFSSLRMNPLVAQALAYYVPLMATPSYREGTPEDLEKQIETFLSGPKRLLLIQGDSGGGKSTFMQHLAQKLWGGSGRVPLLIELKAISSTSDNFFEATLKEQYGLSDADLEELRQKETVILLDGFDEKPGKPCNLFATNQLKRWNCKVVISCRQEFLINQSYHPWFVVDREFYKECQETFVAPFSWDQVGGYLDRICLTVHPWSRSQYDEALKAKSELKQLIENPLLLRMVIEVLPTLNLSENVSRYTVYEAFIRRWFEREEARLKAVKGSEAKLSKLPPLSAFYLFAEKLAMQMCQYHLVEVNYSSSSPTAPENLYAVGEPQENPEAKLWEKFFSDIDEEIALTRAGCPLRSVAQKYSFYHKSLLEFFAAAYLFKTLFSPRVDQVLKNVAHLPLNTLYLSQEPAILEFFVEALNNQSARIDLLTQIILASKHRSEFGHAASNAITILNAANVSFGNKDFSDIHIPYADLDGANFDHCSLAGAHLQHVTLRRAWLRRADLSRADLEGVVFGERPSLSFEDKDRVNAMAYHPHRNVVAVAVGNDIDLWDLDTYRCLATLMGHGGRVTSVAFSPDGKLLASGSKDRSLKVWGVAGGENTLTLTGHRGKVTSLSFSPDGKLLASGSDDKSLKVWEVAGGKNTLTLMGHGAEVTSLSFSPDGKLLASGSDDKSLKVWEVAGGKNTLTLTGHGAEVTSLSFSPDGKLLASGSWDQSLKVWEVAGGKNTLTLMGHGSLVTSVAFSPDGKLLASGSWDQSLKVWEVAGGKNTLTLTGHEAGVTSVAFSPDGKLLASGSWDQSLKVWEVAGGKNTLTLMGHRAMVNSLSFSPDGKLLASGSWDQSLKVWEVAGGKNTLTLTGHGAGVTSVAFSPDGKLLASGSYDKNLKVWEVAGGKNTLTFMGHEGWVTSVAFSPDGKLLASGSKDRSLKVWEVAGGKNTLTLEGHWDWVTSLSFSPDGKLLASGSDDKSLKVWEVAGGKNTLTLKGHGDSVTSLSFSPDGKLLASGSKDQSLKVWEVAGGKNTLTLMGHGARVTSLSFSPDGKLLASGSYDESLKVWSLETGRCLLTLNMQMAILSVTFCEGYNLAIGCSDGEIYYFELDKNSGNDIRMRWRGRRALLIAEGLKLDGALNLSTLNQRLLEQRGCSPAPAALHAKPLPPAAIPTENTSNSLILNQIREINLRMQNSQIIDSQSHQNPAEIDVPPVPLLKQPKPSAEIAQPPPPKPADIAKTAAAVAPLAKLPRPPAKPADKPEKSCQMM